MVAIWISLFAFPETTDWRTDRDNPILERFVDFRNSPLTSFSDRDAVVGSPWSFRVLRIRTLVARIPARRIRHLVAVLPAIILVGVKVDGLQIVAGRPRPFVPTIGDIG